MVVCGMVYVMLFIFRLWKRKRTVFLVLFLFNTIAMFLFMTEWLQQDVEGILVRNSYGEGNRIEVYDATIEGKLENETFEIVIGERQYTSEEIQQIFQQMMLELDEIILGENESRDRVETDLNLVSELEGYPVQIRWELDSYEVIDLEGKILEENTKEKGTLVEVRGILSYEQEEASYVTHVMVYPKDRTGKEAWVNAIKECIKETEEETKKDKNFLLPREVQGEEVQWSKKADRRGYYVLLLGGALVLILSWKEKQETKEKQQKREAEMIRDYPDIISKVTLLLSTGMTVKNVWSKIVHSYEEQKSNLGVRAAYEEMCITYREMQRGIPETEAYERFGKRCGVVLYMKFGALLSQNMKKGSKGLGELLKLESIQAFEHRKGIAKQKGEEASTKLLLPMFGMLAVVMVMVIVPAFLSIQI